MVRFDVDLTLNYSDMKVTLYNVQAPDFQTAVVNAVGFMASPRDWRCTGVDRSQVQAQDDGQGPGESLPGS